MIIITLLFMSNKVTELLSYSFIAEEVQTLIRSYLEYSPGSSGEPFGKHSTLGFSRSRAK